MQLEKLMVQDAIVFVVVMFDAVQIQDDIATLRSVLNTKSTRAAYLRQQLGLTAMADIKHDIHLSLRTIRESQTYDNIILIQVVHHLNSIAPVPVKR